MGAFYVAVLQKGELDGGVVLPLGVRFPDGPGHVGVGGAVYPVCQHRRPALPAGHQGAQDHRQGQDQADQSFALLSGAEELGEAGFHLLRLAAEAGGKGQGLGFGGGGEEKLAVGAFIAAVVAGYHGGVAAGLHVPVRQAVHEPDQGVEPVEGAGAEEEYFIGHVTAFDVVELVAESRHRKAIGGQEDGGAPHSQGHGTGDGFAVVEGHPSLQAQLRGVGLQPGDGSGGAEEPAAGQKIPAPLAQKDQRRPHQPDPRQQGGKIHRRPLNGGRLGHLRAVGLNRAPRLRSRLHRVCRLGLPVTGGQGQGLLPRRGHRLDLGGLGRDCRKGQGVGWGLHYHRGLGLGKPGGRQQYHSDDQPKPPAGPGGVFFLQPSPAQQKGQQKKRHGCGHGEHPQKQGRHPFFPPSSSSR